MLVKVLTSTLVGIDNFCQDPLTSMLKADNGTLAILCHNIPAFYAITPQRLANLLALESNFIQKNNIFLNKNIFKRQNTENFASVGKFSMYQGWHPDIDFQRQAAVWGITLKEPVTTNELAAFITYWEAEGCLFHHVQWQQKLARHVQMNRIINSGYFKRDITQISNTDYDIPDGFRGE
ncbi:primosomal protein DnaT [Pantoea sp. Aalb]|uniref:primosomal protein DnaT n=1 Tax=Pantoea sp. Aalb TaxID=2576762 RepID=UPI00132558C2|nr:primosomal protein DnaT [Pantoea sp. Aalb]MXP67635.1 primosomal protein DnaT [Pantoea sp. Aalb]